MSLDTKYRPTRYGDVLGQEASISILKQFVVSGKGFHQSYLFCGSRGRGKTTLGRILARALLCESPQGGEPCDQCSSCVSMLRDGTSEAFTEVDAASNSGKEDVRRVTDEIKYSTFSGRRRLYLFDEAHQLTKGALDNMLLPLEQPVPGTGPDGPRQLVCIFCTTEPEKMQATILSRCAPAFVVQPQTPDVIAQRLAYVCDQEGLDYDIESLRLIAEITECHIRDALKAVEGVSMLGSIGQENVSKYLHLDLNDAYLDVLSNIGTDIVGAYSALQRVLQRVGPVTCYQRLTEAAMLAYRVSLGEKAASFWNAERLKQIGMQKKETLLGYASRFGSRPGRPTDSMLMLDVAHLHHVGGSAQDTSSVIVHVAAPAAPASVQNTAPRTTVGEGVQVQVATPSLPVHTTPSKPLPQAAKKADPMSPWYINPKAEVRDAAGVAPRSSVRGQGSQVKGVMDPHLFCQVLSCTLAELMETGNGSAG